MKKEYIRYFLYGIVIAIGLVLWNTWQQEHTTVEPTSERVATVSETTSAKQPQSNSVLSVSQSKSIPASRLIQITTDLVNVSIDTLGGNVVKVSLPKYPETLKNKKPFVLLNNNPDTLYIAQWGSISDDHSTDRLQFHASQQQFSLQPNQKELVVILSAKDAKGILYKKTYTFLPNSYAIQVQYQIKNNSGHSWTGNYFTQLTRKELSKKQKKGISRIGSFFGIALSSPENHYQKIDFSKLNKQPIDQNITGGWLAMVQHYFLGSFVPNPKDNYHYYSQVNDNAVYTAGARSQLISLKPHQTTTESSTLYVGPKIAKQLDAVSPHLSLTIDYGKLWFIAFPLMWLLTFFYHFLGNWGWAIVMVTLIIKIIFYYPSAMSYKSMAGMRKLQPKINALKERLGGDKQGMGKAMMELYRKEKINPLGGCLPILIQIPVFFALYWVLLESVELRQAPFIFWIHDLSVKDPYYVLPIIMGISMFIQQKLSPPPADPTQEKVMLLLPLIMTAFFLAFPAGLVLYWVVNNVLSILQQWYIMYKYNRGDYTKKKSWKDKK